MIHCPNPEQRQCWNCYHRGISLAAGHDGSWYTVADARRYGTSVLRPR